MHTTKRSGKQSEWSEVCLIQQERAGLLWVLTIKFFVFDLRALKVTRPVFRTFVGRSSNTESVSTLRFVMLNRLTRSIIVEQLSLSLARHCRLSEPVISSSFRIDMIRSSVCALVTPSRRCGVPKKMMPAMDMRCLEYRSYCAFAMYKARLSTALSSP